MRGFILPLLLAGIPFRSMTAQGDASFHARLFADMNYGVSERSIPQGFRTGQVAGHLVAPLSERLALFSEISGTAQAAGFAVEVERFMVRYEFSDKLKVSTGRYHTPISYWNTTFHHGTWLQTTMSRPDLVRGGSGFMPLHFVGLELDGTLTGEQLALSYVAGIGNGRHTNVNRAGDAGDANGSRAMVLSTSLRLPSATGFRIGGSIYRDRVTPSAGVDVDEQILSAYIARERETPEFIAEYAVIDHAAHGARASRSVSAYAQLGYRLSIADSRLKPYARIERTHVPDEDPIFRPATLEYRGTSAGLRFDVDPAAALKVEFRRERFELPRWYNSVNVQFSLTVPGFGRKAPTAHDESEPTHENSSAPLAPGR